MANKQQEAEMWVAWTRDAMRAFEVEDDVEELDDVVTDMISVATQYADAMLDEYEERYGSSSGSGRKKRKRRKGNDEESDE